MTDHIRSYAKILALGHRALEPLLTHEVVVEEKVDGSQFSFGMRSGVLHMMSKRVPIHGLEGCPNLFQPTVRHVIACFEARLLVEGWTYRGEAVHAPRHNTLTYARVPQGNFVLFDVDTGLESYVTPEAREQIAFDLGVDRISVIARRRMADITEGDLTQWLTMTSQLGGALIEGVVIKPLACIVGVDGKRLAGKFVSEAFKETHSKEWRTDRPQKLDMLKEIGEAISGPARWKKSVQRLRDEGRLTESPKDIGPLIAEVQRDVTEECEDEIKAMLYAAYRKEIVRTSTNGVAEWYKRELAFGGAR